MSGASGYWLTVATSEGALPTSTSATSCDGACAISVSVTSPSYTPTAGQLSAGVTYYWKVQAFNSGTTPRTDGEFSAVRSLTTQAAEPELLAAPRLANAVPTVITACGAIIAAFSTTPTMSGRGR